MPEAIQPSGVVVTMAVQCAWCRLWRVDTVWTPVAPASVAKVSHGICPECAAAQLAKLEQLKPAA